VPHDEAIHRQATESGDYADETLFDEPSLTVSLIHFADDSHGVRLDLPERGFSIVLDTPAWLDLDDVASAIGVDEPTLGSGYVVVERQSDDGEVGYRLSVQGGDVVGRVSVILLEAELGVLRAGLRASRERVEAADELDHGSEPLAGGDGVGGGGLG
jgi:hypothetical protein